MATLDHIRVGFIGAGRISDLHALEYAANPDASIVAVADVNADLARERAQRWGFPLARIYADYRALLDDPDVDAVEILLPHHLHAEAALAAMDAGKHVSLQKPMTILVADADRLIARARQTGVTFSRLRELRLLSADRQGQGAGRRRRHR